jgi:hypothetical protein
LSHYINGTLQKIAIVRHVVPTIRPIKEGTNLTQNELTILEEVGFSFDHLRESNIQSLFGSYYSCSSNYHVPIAVSCPSLVRPFDTSCWPTTRGGKKMR